MVFSSAAIWSWVPMVMRSQSVSAGVSKWRTRTPRRRRAGIQCRAGHGVAAGEDKVCLALQNGEAHGPQLHDGIGAVFADGLAAAHKIVIFLNGGDPGGLGHPVDVVGIDGITDGIEVRDKRRVADGKAEPRTGQASGFGKGLRNEEIVIARRQCNTALRAEVYVCLVDDDEPVRVSLQDGFNLWQCQGKAGGGIGVGDDNGGGPAQRSPPGQWKNQAAGGWASPACR